MWPFLAIQVSDQASREPPLDKCITAWHLTNVAASGNDSIHSSPNTFSYCFPLLTFCRRDMKQWWKGLADSHINTYRGSAASPCDYADSWSLLLPHNAFPNNTRTVVIQTYCQQSTISNIMPSVLPNHLGSLHGYKVRDSFGWFAVSRFFFPPGFYVGKHIN